MAQAQSAAYSFADPVNGFSSTQGNDGVQFRLTADIRVTALGYYDRNQNGLSQSHPVGIYSVSSQSLLASATVGAGSSLVGLFRYESITPLDLSAGESYRLVGFHPGTGVGGDLYQIIPVGSVTIASPIVHEGNYNNLDSMLSYPTNGPAMTNIFFGPNFLYVPEPSTGLLTLLAAIALAARRRM